MAARPLPRLPAFALAWMLALLIAPAMASACSSVGEAAYIGPNGGNWNDGTHWSTGSLPTVNQIVCVPAGSTVVVDIATAGAGSLTVESGAGLTINGGQKLVIGGGTVGIDSVLQGVVTVGGTLEMKQNVTLSSPGSIDLNGLVVVDALASLTIADGLDVTGGGTLQYDGFLFAQGGTALDPVTIDPQLHGSGIFTNAGANPSPVVLTGGSLDSGTWKLASGDPAPTWTLNGGVYNHDGTITDVDSGGLGDLVLAGGFLQAIAADASIEVSQFDVNAGSDVDFSPSGGGTAHVSVGQLNMAAGAGHLLEVNAPLQAQEIHQTTGTLAPDQNKNWTTATYRWEGGTITATSAHSARLTVTGALDMSGAGARVLDLADLVVTGIGTQDYQYTAGTFDLTNNSTFTIGPDVHFVFGDDVNIGGTAAETIDNQGIIDKQQGAAGSTISPQVNMTSGQLWVTNPSSKLTLALDPDTLVGGELTSGTYILDGELVIPGAVSGFGGNWQLGGSGVLTAAGVDAMTTIDHNAAGSTMTIQTPLSLSQNFTNNGTINVTSGSLTVAAGKTYTQQPGSTTKLSAPGATLTATGGVALAGGTLKGVGSVNANVTNTGGTVAPGNSPGTLTINGNFTQSGTGVYQEEIDGPAAGQFDKLVVIGTATLGGTLLIASTNGYQAPDTQQFQIVDAAGGVAGAWGGVVQSPIAPYFEQIYSPNAMVLIANSVSAGDATVNEGNSATTSATFTISLGQASPNPVSVDWATQDGSATAGSDYTAASGTATFAPGETAKTVTVAVTGDTAVEPDENFAINLSNPVGTRIRDGQGVATITNDDSPQAIAAQVPPGDIDGFLIPPPPIQGRAVNVAPVSGTVLVKLPGKAKFIPLPDAEQVPVGTIVDARKGTVRLFSVGKGGRVQSALFYQGVFKVLQKPGQALTNLELVGGSFAGCPKAARAIAAAKRKKSSSVRHLWGSGSGQFRTTGRFASATIRGTKWLTDDRCDGTLIRVAAGAVTVRDLTRKRSLVLKKPRSYLARG